MSDQALSRVLQAHAALHVTLDPAACQDGRGPVDDAATTTVVPESLGDLIEWCKKHEFYNELQRHNDPEDSYCLPLYTAFVIGYDIKPDSERQLIQINLANIWFLLDAVRAIETGWVVHCATH